MAVGYPNYWYPFIEVVISQEIRSFSILGSGADDIGFGYMVAWMKCLDKEIYIFRKGAER